MNEKTPRVIDRPSGSVSPYLMRPLRSYEEARADIAAARNRANTVTPFVPLVVVSNGHRKSGMPPKSYRAA